MVEVLDRVEAEPVPDFLGGPPPRSNHRNSNATISLAIPSSKNSRVSRIALPPSLMVVARQ